MASLFNIPFLEKENYIDIMRMFLVRDKTTTYPNLGKAANSTLDKIDGFQETFPYCITICIIFGNISFLHFFKRTRVSTEQENHPLGSNINQFRNQTSAPILLYIPNTSAMRSLAWLSP